MAADIVYPTRLWVLENMDALGGVGVLKEEVELKRRNVCALQEEWNGGTFSAARGARRAMRGIIKHGSL